MHFEQIETWTDALPGQEAAETVRRVQREITIGTQVMQELMKVGLGGAAGSGGFRGNKHLTRMHETEI